MTSLRTAISPTRAENYAEWYQQVIKASELAESSTVRGCMVIKPWGYAIWELIQAELDQRIKATGHKNAYFPLFIPLSFLEKEASHIKGFAKECAIVTHSRLQADERGKLQLDSPLEEPLVVRPTSEAIVGEAYSRWIHSYRDLPLLLNQWANVVRWEMRTRLFLRTTEFLWQEGHTAHATREEAEEETRIMLEVYAEFAQNVLGIAVIKGLKTQEEKFPGAEQTYCIEAMMQDRKALQVGTSHFLGQNFARAYNIGFLDHTGQRNYAWTTSWGVSTRLMGGLIMTHSDDDGLVLPPKVAPSQIVILPVIKREEDRAKILEAIERLEQELKLIHFEGKPIRFEVDNRDIRGGEKAWQWIKKGVPFRLEIGAREIEQGTLSVNRRDNGEKQSMEISAFLETLPKILENVQKSLLDKAYQLRAQNTVELKTKEEIQSFFTPKDSQKPEIYGGFAVCGWRDDPSLLEWLQREFKVSVRCILMDREGEEDMCPFSGKSTRQKVILARSY